MTTQVLIVEDEDSLRAIYKYVLSKMGCTTFEAANGQQAISCLEQATPQVILLDVMLPGMNGDKVIEYVQRTPRLHQTRILIISSNKSYEYFADVAHNITFALKPIRPNDIRNFINAEYV